MAELKYVDWDGLVYYDGKIKDYVDLKNGECLRIGGNVTFEELPRPSISNVNYIYKINESFTSNDDFEKPDYVYEAGTIVQVSEFDDVYLYTIFNENTSSVAEVVAGMEQVKQELNSKATISYVDNQLAEIKDSITYGTF